MSETRPRYVIPKPETLAKWDLTPEEWVGILERQGWVCAVCGKAPSTGRYNVDHQHGRQRGRKWKDVPPAQKRALIRGLLCVGCNRFVVGWGVTVAKLRAAAAYLERHAGQLVR